MELNDVRIAETQRKWHLIFEHVYQWEEANSLLHKHYQQCMETVNSFKREREHCPRHEEGSYFSIRERHEINAIIDLKEAADICLSKVKTLRVKTLHTTLTQEDKVAIVGEITTALNVVVKIMNTLDRHRQLSRMELPGRFYHITHELLQDQNAGKRKLESQNELPAMDPPEKEVSKRFRWQ